MDLQKYVPLVVAAEHFANIAFFAVFGLWLVMIAYGTLAKNKWGVNFGRVACPECRTGKPLFRLPTSARQAIWGGYTCLNCGCEVDKWGRRVAGETP